MVDVDPRAEWIAAFLTAQSKLPKIGKDREVDAGRYTYSYAPLPDILEKVSEKLRAEGLVLNQSVVGDGATVGVETRIYHKSGHVETFGPLLIKVPGDAQSAGSAITYARRYALCAALGIAPDEDDDGAQASKPAPTQAQTEGDVAWRWLWEESKIFKAWSDKQRESAIVSAMRYLAIEEVSDRELADRIFAHLSGVYENRPQPEQESLLGEEKA